METPKIDIEKEPTPPGTGLVDESVLPKVLAPDKRSAGHPQAIEETHRLHANENPEGWQ